MLEGRIYQLKPGTKKLPQNMQKDHEPLIVLYTKKLDIPPRDFTKGVPGLEDIFKWFGVQYRGVITIREAGQYKFRLFSDDGSKLYIDDVLVIDNDGVHDAKSETGEVSLSAGTHSIRVDYFQGPKKRIALQLFVTPPGEAEKLFDQGDF
ncbi:MAG: beta-glucosidase [Spirochaetota bacterium]|nr:MAG: beta-glucosidase [Spirochaetota bacterium]